MCKYWFDDHVCTLPLELHGTEGTGLTLSLAVASRSPSELKAMARRGPPCAGMMVTLPVAVSTTWNWPGVRPGKATCLLETQSRPLALSAVSYSFLKSPVYMLNIWILFNRATMTLCAETLTARIAVRVVIVELPCCLLSSQSTTYGSCQHRQSQARVLNIDRTQSTCLIGGKLGFLSSSN